VSRPEAGVGRGFLKLGIGEALAQLISFGATVYLARRLGADAYGMIVLATVVMSYIGPVMDSGVELLGVHDVARDPATLPSLLPTYLGGRLFLAAVLIAAVDAVGLLLLPPVEGSILAAYVFLLAPMALSTRWVHLGLDHPGLVSMSRIASELLSALLIVVLVQGASDVTRVPFAQILGELLAAFLLMRALPTVSVTARRCFRPAVIRTLYRRSWPLVLNALLGLVIFNSDSFFLRIYRDSATLGYYAAAYALVSFMLTVGRSYQMTLMPAVSRSMDDPDRERGLYHSAMAQAFAGVFPVALGGSLVAPRLIPWVFGLAYLPSVLPLQILLWALPVALLRNVAQGVMIAHGRQDQMLRTSSLAAMSNIVLNLALIPMLGMVAAAIITVVTEALRTVPMLWLLSNAGLPMTPPRRFWRSLLAGLVMATVVVLAPLPAVWMSVAAGGTAYVVALYLAGGIRFRRGELPELLV
jgi:O-antigen/teichoic acid export membrane protein